MSNPSGYIDDSEQLSRDLQWNQSVIERNRHGAMRLMQKLSEHIEQPESILEIGAGIGTMLNTFSELGIDVCGYDINIEATEYGKNQFGLDLHSDYWQHDTTHRKYELVMSISVLEHIESPRELIQQISKYCARYKAEAFISVPFLERDKWHFLFDTDPYLTNTPFLTMTSMLPTFRNSEWSCASKSLERSTFNS
jgi:2-polyprenyl-3-methyl-5-hydroxy-6-metoxy-1,4-benzoquinol methylase